MAAASHVHVSAPQPSVNEVCHLKVEILLFSPWLWRVSCSTLLGPVEGFIRTLLAQLKGLMFKPGLIRQDLVSTRTARGE